MGKTISEKILSKKSVERRELNAGDYVGVKIDGLLLPAAVSQVDAKAVEAGLPGGLPRPVPAPREQPEPRALRLCRGSG